jgi:hypothetical protein
MTALTSPKGPLPARVYWFRRLLLLVVALLLVFGIARVLGGGSDASSETPTATRAAATGPASTSAGTATDAATGTATDAATDAATVEGPASGPGAEKRKNKPAPTPTPTPVPPTPTGVCSNEDIAIAPNADGATAGGRVQLLLVLRTKVTPACTWQVSPDTVTLKITSGSDDIWASRECPRSIAVQDVTVYRDFDTTVPVVWSGRRSDEECSKLAEWADPGWYHLLAATYAGEPVDLQFELGVPAPVTVTKTVEPTPTGSGSTPSSSPSGAVEPDGG